MGKRKLTADMEREVARILASSNEGVFYYHPVGSDGAWPAWMHGFKQSCGVYAIRDKSTHKVLYVGSSKSRLYDTITRHFQSWRRAKRWWKGYAGHHDPGMTYERSRCEVAVILTACGDHLEEEARQIQRLHPRDNLVMSPDGSELEDAPF